MAFKVLVAEDKDDSRKLIKSMLEIYGYEVIEAGDGAQAVAKCLEMNPDLILMDLAMPVMDGVEAAKKIRENQKFRQIPIICITAYGDIYTEKARAAGCDHLMKKPIDFRILDPLINQFVGAV